jgi:hypothetical protein
VFSHEEQMEIVKPIAALLSDADQGPFRTIIVDSIIALFRTEFHGRGDLSERQQKLGQHLSHLVRLSEEFNIAGTNPRVLSGPAIRSALCNNISLPCNLLVCLRPYVALPGSGDPEPVHG